jgi:hypothetical protein
MREVGQRPLSDVCDQPSTYRHEFNTWQRRSNSAWYQCFDVYRCAVKQRAGIARLRFDSKQASSLSRYTVRGALALHFPQFLNFRMVQFSNACPAAALLTSASNPFSRLRFDAWCFPPARFLPPVLACSCSCRLPRCAPSCLLYPQRTEKYILLLIRRLVPVAKPHKQRSYILAPYRHECDRIARATRVNSTFGSFFGGKVSGAFRERLKTKSEMPGLA